MKNPPDIIYLQVYEDEDGDDFYLYDERTWCADEINETDIEYARTTVKRYSEEDYKLAVEEGVMHGVSMFAPPTDKHIGLAVDDALESLAKKRTTN